MAKSLEAGKLIVGAIAVSIDPTGTAATALGIDTALTLKNWITGAPKITKLARDLDKQFHKELATPRYDKPSEARALLPQMLTAAFPKGAEIAECGLDADQILASMHRTLATKDSEYRKAEITAAFDTLILPLLQAACDDPSLETTLRPHLTRKQMADQRETKDDVKDIKSMMEAVLGGAAIPLEDMKTLAARFDEHDISDKATLEQFLKLKADEYRALKSEVDQIDAGLKRLSNLKAAAQDAIARVDLDEVETLLSRVQEVELEEAAKTAELRATNALLRGKVEQAYALLSAAADSFAAVDPLEPTRRKVLKYAERLARHGMQHGGSGLQLSGNLLTPILNDQLLTANPLLWAAGKNALAIALRNQGIRTSGEDGSTLLAQAVDAYRSALRISTEADHPVQWATTQNNLASALQEQGIRTNGEDGAALLAQAVDAYHSALRIRTEADHPVHWATTQNNLAAALTNQGIRTSGEDGATLLAQAVDAYRNALRIRAEADHPVHWATTQENMAIAERAIAQHDSTGSPRPHLVAALNHVDNALKIYDPTHMPYNHDKATALRTKILADLDTLDTA